MNPLVDKLKTQTNISRADIAKLLSSIGGPGEKKQEKVNAIKELNRSNRQGYDISETLETYEEY